MNGVISKLTKVLNSKRGISLVLMGPAQFLIFFIAIIPFALEIYLSFTPWSPTMGDLFSAPFNYGMNYVKLLTQDTRYLLALGRTVLFTVVAVTVQLLLGILLAALVDRDFPGSNIVFVILLIPMMFMPVVVGLVFYMIFQSGGPLNHVLSIILQQNITIDWLTNEFTLFIAAVIADTWHWTPFMFLIALCGMRAISPNIIDAARTLGASEWQIFRKIKLPMIRNVLLIAVTIRALESTKIFDELVMFAGGRLNYLYENVSIWTYIMNAIQNQIGYASAGALIVLVIIAVLTFNVILKVLSR